MRQALKEALRAHLEAVVEVGVRATGAILLVGGLGLVIVLVYDIDLTVRNTDALGNRLGRIAAVTAILAAPLLFCAYGGYRFLLNRPTKNGTLFSSFFWALIGLALVVCDGFVILIARAETLTDWKPPLSLLALFLLAGACFRNAYAVRKRREDGGATSN